MFPPMRLRRLPPGGATNGPAKPVARWPLGRSVACDGKPTAGHDLR